jgi:hypothetical protein
VCLLVNFFASQILMMNKPMREQQQVKAMIPSAVKPPKKRREAKGGDPSFHSSVPAEVRSTSQMRKVVT